MQFTEKEIELAKQMKEAGLEWSSSFGDVVLIQDELLTREYRNNLKWKGLTEGIEIYDNYFTGIVIGTLNLLPYGDLEVAVWDTYRWIVAAEQLIWLPSWHQCRKILYKHNLELTISDTNRTKVVALTLWKRITKGGLEFFSQVVADMDLEAMYRAILEVLHKPVSSQNE